MDGCPKTLVLATDYAPDTFQGSGDSAVGKTESVHKELMLDRERQKHR